MNMNRIKELDTRLNDSGNENREREKLFIQQKENAYYLKIVKDLENQSIQKLYLNNPLQLDKDSRDEQIKDWINKVNKSRIIRGYGYPYDAEQVIIQSRVFIEDIFNELAKKKLRDSVIISKYRFDTGAWSVTEFLCCDSYNDKEVFLMIKMYDEIDSDNAGSVLERYGKIPEGLTDEEIESEDFEYILPEKIDGVNIWYDGFILWSEELVSSHITRIVPLKLTKKTTIDDINKWLKGDKVHYSYLSDEEITQEEFNKIINCNQQCV